MMTLQEAAKLCRKKGDQIRSANGEYAILFEHFDHHGGFLVNTLLRCEEWLFIPAEPKLKTRDEIKKSLTDALESAPLINQDIIESMVDIFLIYQGEK